MTGNKYVKYGSWFILMSILIMGLVGPLFTSSVPWKYQQDGRTEYPAWQVYLHDMGIKDLPPDWNLRDWSDRSATRVDNVIAYSANYIDARCIGATAPGIHAHVLGTDLQGRDILAGLVQGARISLTIAFWTTCFSLLFALFYTITTSYFGNNRLRLSILQIVIIALLMSYLGFILFISFQSTSFFWFFSKCILFFIVLMVLIAVVNKYLDSKSIKSYAIPLDNFGVQGFLFFYSIPKHFILIILLGMLVSKSLIMVAFILALVIWSRFYTIMRIEILRLKSTNRFVALQNLGLGDVRILLRHLIPSLWSVLATPIIFCFASAITLDASLSFLGFGIGQNTVTWGSILAQVKEMPNAWWIGLFPSILLFLSIYSLHLLSRQNQKIG